MMDITKSREEFEEKFPMPKHVIRCGSGYAVTSYSAWEANSYLDLWVGWQAARESLVIDLPQKISEFNRMPDNGAILLEAVNYDEAIDDCAEAIRAAGIRIKGNEKS